MVCLCMTDSDGLKMLSSAFGVRVMITWRATTCLHLNLVVLVCHCFYCQWCVLYDTCLVQMFQWRMTERGKVIMMMMTNFFNPLKRMKHLCSNWKWNIMLPVVGDNKIIANAHVRTAKVCPCSMLCVLDWLCCSPTARHYILRPQRDSWQGKGKYFHKWKDVEKTRSLIVAHQWSFSEVLMSARSHEDTDNTAEGDE